jgi:hypothetical protein
MLQWCCCFTANITLRWAKEIERENETGQAYAKNGRAVGERYPVDIEKKNWGGTLPRLKHGNSIAAGCAKLDQRKYAMKYDNDGNALLSVHRISAFTGRKHPHIFHTKSRGGASDCDA